jgi:hemerythrin-like domain-containing protein
MTTTIALLSTQHQDVLANLSAVEADLAAGTDAGLPAFAAYLEREVMHHFALEEQSLFPALARHLPASQGPLAVMSAEHAEFRALLAHLAAAVRAGSYAGQRAHATEIVALLRAHIDKEDHVLFPLAEQLLSAEELAEVDRTARLAGAVPAP